MIPVGIYMFKVNNRNNRTRCEICSKLTIKTLECSKLAIKTPCSIVSIVNFEHVNSDWDVTKNSLGQSYILPLSLVHFFPMFHFDPPENIR